MDASRRELTDFANALREALGLEPLYVKGDEPKGRCTDGETLRRFYVGEWSTSPERTPRRSSRW